MPEDNKLTLEQRNRLVLLLQIVSPEWFASVTPDGEYVDSEGFGRMHWFMWCMTIAPNKILAAKNRDERVWGGVNGFMTNLAVGIHPIDYLWGAVQPMMQ
jgi:hypothetical protein